MATPPSHSQSLLPNPAIVILDGIERDEKRFRLRVHVEQEPTCPLCGEVSRSRHSCYCRCLQDFPWQGVSVQLWATVGRFHCRNASCPRKIFCERLPGVARAYGRQTERAAEIIRLVGYVAGGLPGQRDAPMDRESQTLRIRGGGPLRLRPPEGHVRRGCGRGQLVEHWTGGRPNQPPQNDQASDVWARRLRTVAGPCLALLASGLCRSGSIRLHQNCGRAQIKLTKATSPMNRDVAQRSQTQACQLCRSHLN